MIIRKAAPSDEKLVLDLLVELRKSGYQEMGKDIGDIKLHDKAPELFLNLLTRDDCHIILAETDGKITGLAVAYEIPKILDGRNRMLIEEMVILPEFRGKGLGSKLLSHLENMVVNKGMTHIKVATGTKLRANKFYAKHGFIHFENAYRKKIG